MKSLERFIGYGVVFAIVMTVALGVYTVTTKAQAPAATASSGAPIAFVDDAALDKDFPAIVNAKKQIKQLDDEKTAINAEFNAKVKSIQGSIQRQFEEKTKGMSESEKQKFLPVYEDMFTAQVASLRKEINVKVVEVENKQTQIWKEAVEKVREVVTAVAKDQGLGLVLKKDIIWFGGKDITSDVLKKGGVTK